MFTQTTQTTFEFNKKVWTISFSSEEGRKRFERAFRYDRACYGGGNKLIEYAATRDTAWFFVTKVESRPW